PAVLQFHVFHISRKLADVAGDTEPVGLLHRPAHFNSAGDRRVSRNLPLEVSSYKRIKIKPGKFDGGLSWPIATQMDVSVHAKLSVSKSGAAAQHCLFTMRFYLHGHIAHQFVVQHNVVQIKLAIDY